MPAEEFVVGESRHGFTVTARTPLPELNATLLQLRHDRTGARMVHLATTDRNNLFAVGFRTPPADSSGIAHILEHTTLCGSQRFPVRDPFFAMIRRSLNTFMNAMTASDWTFYPFASQNRTDFYNLLSIYLDATFFPLLREADFHQEGHRLEFADPDDPATPLVRRGVVFNEMQGAMAAPSSLLSRRLSRTLYPTTTYRFNSGGEPGEIPSLTWEALRDFHAEYYHPSNAWFFTYGDLPLDEHLFRIENEVLQRFERRSVTSEVPPEQRFDQPRCVSESYPVSPDEECSRKTFVQMAWLCCDVAESYERLALSLLSNLLIGNPAAPLYKALLDTRLGDNLAPGAGYHDDNRTTYFAIGLQGCAPESVAAVEAVILSTLEEVVRSGFSPERIDGAIHRLEFDHREVTGNGYPYPLSLLFRMLGPWLHNDDPVSPLLLDAHLARLRREISQGPFLEGMIRRWLLENPHRVTLVLRPDPEMQRREEAESAEELEKLKETLTAEERDKLIIAARDLQHEQERSQDLSLLPTLTPADIPRQEETPVCRQQSGRLWTFPQPTNGIGYLIGHLPADRLKRELRPFLPLWCAVLPQLGSGGLPWTATAERIESATGGIQFSTETLQALDGVDSFRPVVEVRAKALVRNQDRLVSLLADLCATPDFHDPDRLRTLLGQFRVNLENAVVGSGHSYAARAAAACLSAPARQREEWGGLSLLRRVRMLAGDTENLEAFSALLSDISEQLVDGAGLRLAMTAEENDLDGCAVLSSLLFDRLPCSSAVAQETEPFSPISARVGWAFNAPVNFVTRVWRTVPYADPDAPALAVLARLLRATYLHREIREKGGAYGGLAVYDTEGGLFSLLSYRDPHIARTLRVYDDALAWVVSGAFTTNDLDEALLAVFADLDRPLSPGGRGNREFDNLQQGLTQELRQRHRDRLLAVDRDDLLRVARRHLLEGAVSAVSVLGAEESLLRANQELGAAALLIERV